MASLALSVVGTAIGGPLLGALGSMVGGMIDNVLFPQPKPPLPVITTSTYGNAIPLAYGPQNRLGVNMIWSSGFLTESSKQAKIHLGKTNSKGVQAYTINAAFAVCAGPIDTNWLVKLWANGGNIFDATVATTTPTPDGNGVVTWDLSNMSMSMFDTLVVYPGNDLQLPDPTIEAALGVGNVPAYRGTAYVMINGLQVTAFGNGVPQLNLLCAAQQRILVADIVADFCTRSGLPLNVISTPGLTTEVEGYNITFQSDGVSAIQPLALCYDFDVAEVAGNLRCVPRGQDPICVIPNDNLAGYAFGDTQPDAYDWPRAPETTLPMLAALTFNDPTRDCQQNTQSSKRQTGNAQSNLSDTVQLTLSSIAAQSVCDRMLWEAQIGRQSLKANVTEQLIFIEAAKTYAFESPAGLESVRITKRTKGTNGVIELEGKRDYSALYFSTAPGSSANSSSNELLIAGPVNAPFFIEPPSNFPGISQPSLIMAVSGGSAGVYNPSWNGCTIYVSTNADMEDAVLIGSMFGPSDMGVTTATLGSYGGSNPDNTNHLFVSTLESGGSPPSISMTDAQQAQIPYYVGGEFLSAQNVTDDGGFQFELTTLYRGLYGTTRDARASGSPFVRIDSLVFTWPFPSPVYIGVPLYFRFVSSGETFDSTTIYEYTPNGDGYGTGLLGLPGLVL